MKKVRLGIIGAGNMGSGHVQNILAGKTPLWRTGGQTAGNG